MSMHYKVMLEKGSWG